jgi:DNA-binding NarL/FixJ family response regulator
MAPSAVVRAGLESILRGSPDLEVVGAVSAAGDLADAVAELHPDVILAEPDAPETGALPVAEADGLPALVLLSDDPESTASVEALRFGSRAVLPRQAQPEEIVAAVQAVSAGLAVIHVDVAAPLLDHLSGIGRPRDASPTESLTPREIEVLGMLAEGAGNKIIARRLGISEHTVKFHVGSIMAKLNAASRTEAVTLGIRHGLILL